MHRSGSLETSDDLSTFPMFFNEVDEVGSFCPHGLSDAPAARNDVIVLHGMQHWTNAWWPWNMSKNYYAQLTKCWQVGLVVLFSFMFFCLGKVTMTWLTHTHIVSKHDSSGYSGMKSGFGEGWKSKIGVKSQMFHLQPWVCCHCLLFWDCPAG